MLPHAINERLKKLTSELGGHRWIAQAERQFECLIGNQEILLLEFLACERPNQATKLSVIASFRVAQSS